MNKLFADTFYFLALLNRNDEAHTDALSFAQTYDGNLITTAWVLVETGDAMSDPGLRAAFVRFWQAIRTDPTVEIIPAGSALLDRGLALYAARPDKGWSVTDCISFVVMEDRGLTEALTADHHFEQAGFTALLKT